MGYIQIAEGQADLCPLNCCHMCAVKLVCSVIFTVSLLLPLCIQILSHLKVLHEQRQTFL